MDTRKKVRAQSEPKPDSQSDEEVPSAQQQMPASKDIPPPIKRPDTLNLGAPTKKDSTVSETLLSDLLGRLDDLSTKVDGMSKETNGQAGPSTLPVTYQKMLFTKFTPGKITPKFVEESLEQFESWLKMTKIENDDERFHLLKMLIEPETYQQVGNIITSPPDTGKYNTLRDAIIKAFTESEAQRLKSLLGGIQLGSRRPTHLLAEMSNLYKGPKDKLFNELFMSRLPATVRAILVSMERNQPPGPPPTINMIAQWADAIIEQTENQANLNQINSDPSSNLTKIIDGLVHKIDKLSFTPKRKQENKKDDICFFHRRHGKGKHLNRRCDKSCRLWDAWNKHKQTLKNE